MLSSWEGGKIGLGVASRLCTSDRLVLTFLVKLLVWRWLFCGHVTAGCPHLLLKEKLLRQLLHDPVCMYVCVHRSLGEYLELLNSG